MKKIAAAMAVVLVILVAVSGCGESSISQVPGETQVVQSEQEEAGNEMTVAEGYADGVYRGFYKKANEEEMAVQFELVDSKFVTVNFRSVKYKGENYLSKDATDIQKQIIGQYRQAGDYLVGKSPETISELLHSKDMISDMDAVTGATLNTDKLFKALHDGLERNVFKPDGDSVVMLTGDYADGVYEGSYDDGGVEQISVEVTVKDNSFVSVKYNSLNYGQRDYLEEGASGVTRQVADQYREAARYLEGKKLTTLSQLYEPVGLLQDQDAVTGPTLRTNKLISAVNDALAGGPRQEKAND